MAMRAPAQGANAVALDIPFTRYIDRDGTVAGALPEFTEQPACLESLYRAMVLTRAFDEKAVALQRTGRLGTFASSLGQEAVGVGLASAMSSQDVLLPSFREQGAMLWRGVTVAELLLYWGGDERGSDFAGPREDFPICVPVGTQFPHAVGVGLAFKLRGEARVAVVVGGDGATSKGDFYEALNIAGVWQLPVVFIIANNQWAISVPRRSQTAAGTLAQKAIAAGVPGEQVDGNDVIAVRSVVERVVSQARAGHGPSLVEALTYRLSDHTTADDARRYRDDDEVSEAWRDDPVARLKALMASRGAWTKELELNLLERCRAEIEQGVESYLSTKPPAATEMIDHLYNALPDGLASQRELIDRMAGGRHG